MGLAILIVCLGAGMARWDWPVAPIFGAIAGALGSYASYQWRQEVFGPDTPYPYMMIVSAILTSALVYWAGRGIRRWWEWRFRPRT